MSARGALDVRRSDVVVVGAGAAGLAVALHAGGRQVTILAKGRLDRGSSSVLAQGGVAVAVGADDGPGLHAADTVAAACGLADPEVVDLVTSEGPRRLAELVALGAAFDRAPDGGLSLGLEAAHSRRRVVHAAGDRTGAEIVRALGRAAAARSQVRVEEDCLALELVEDGGRVVGVLAADGAGRRVLHLGQAVVLATGGIGHLFEHTTNPREATGDGLAMAARAGAVLADLEMVQFHPTALGVGTDPRPLLTEALRGEGAALVDEDGTRFLGAVHHDAELAPRDVVARGIWRHARLGHSVLLDATGLGERLAARFPAVVALCAASGLDVESMPVPVTPAAHYHMGGVVTSRDGRTSLEGLWACGEVASTGLHGANRLASNSLLEALVFGARVGEDLAGAVLPVPDAAHARRAAALRLAADPWSRDDGSRRVVAELRRLCWERLGLERSGFGLVGLLGELDRLVLRLPAGVGEAGNMALVARLVAMAALAREESRGAHFRTDFPASDPRWCQRLTLRGGRVELPPGVPARVAAII